MCKKMAKKWFSYKGTYIFETLASAASKFLYCSDCLIYKTYSFSIKKAFANLYIKLLCK